jgi:tRNA pseudouridine38-40 synthase
MRLAMTVEYEGTNYHGFQYQVNAPTIQEELEKAIARLTGHHVRIKGAGRTDAGVHALGQVIAFDTQSDHEPGVVVRALNYYLPDDIAVKAAYRVAADFDPRRSALSRTYRYTILNSQAPSPLMRRTARLVPQDLDVPRMGQAASLLVGRHDFARFSGPLDDRSASTVRQVKEACVVRDGELVLFEIKANSFLPHQVRRMAGALLDVGRDRLKMDEFKQMIEGDGDGRRRAHSLPAGALCLMSVEYAGFPPQTGENDGV